MKVLRLVLLASLALAAVPSAVGQTNDDINTKTLADHPHHNDENHTNVNNNDNNEVPFVKNQGRACPDGFFYAGEPSSLPPADRKQERWEVWEKGPATPVYSCYAFLKAEKMSLSGANLGCDQLRGQLISINQVLEEEILLGSEFTARLNDLHDDLNSPVLTSGLYLGGSTWTWFGADEPIAADLVAKWSHNATHNPRNPTAVVADQDPSLQCLTIRWVKDATGEGQLQYQPTSCLNTFDIAVCEARVYTQTWYVWFYVNWLQILFFFTMSALILATCCIFTSWLFRPSGRQGRVVQGHVNTSPAPPPYTQHQQYTTPQYRASEVAANYARKGREILAKVVFYKQGNEKPPLA